MEKTGAFEMEKAIARQPAILSQDWTEQWGAKTRGALKGVKSVTFVGTGSSYHCALWAQWLCLSYGRGVLKSQAMMTWDFLSGEIAARIERTELIVVISHRGNKNLTKRLLAASGRGKRILIAGLDAPSGAHPCIRTSPQEVSGAHTMSLMGAIGAAAEIVASLVSETDGRKLRAERRLTALLLEQLLSRQELQRSLQTVLSPGSGLHFIGGGPFHAIALELALKARETIHVPAHAYNTEEFLHGPLASVEDRDTLVALAPLHPPANPTARYLYQKRLETCRRAAEAVGAMVVAPYWEKAIENEAARLGLCWQALLPLYWGQLLCVATARKWDLNPDLNRRDDPRYEEARRRIEL